MENVDEECKELKAKVANFAEPPETVPRALSENFDIYDFTVIIPEVS